MTSSYGIRLACLLAASFFLVHLLAGLAVAAIAPAAIRMAARMRARLGARFLLALRLAPAVFSAAIVAGLCAPSYLWLEPDAGVEEVGTACLAAAAASIAILGSGVLRGLRAAQSSFRYGQLCERAGRKTHLAGERGPVWIIEAAAPFLALAGVVRPRLVISRDVVRALSSDQLSVALRHERAHRISCDNLKRLFLLLAPDLLPFVRGFTGIERGWSRLTEWAADDRAAEGSARRSVALAAALVRVARLSAAQTHALASPLLADTQDLSTRVDRLLHPVAPNEAPERRARVLLCGAAVAVTACVSMLVLNPATLAAVHRALEQLMR